MRREEVEILDISVLTNSPASSMLPCTTPTAVFFSAERREGREGEEERGRVGRERKREGGRGRERGVDGKDENGKMGMGN